MKKLRVLIGSCVCQSPKILERFLAALKKLTLSPVEASFLFIDDNQDPASSEILRRTAFDHETAIAAAPPRDVNYYTNETTHYWDNSLIMRIATLKNSIITHAIENGYDYLFLIDSDLIIDPGLIVHLIAQGKEIISEIFWTAWQPDTKLMPNVWMCDTYEMASPLLPANDIARTAAEFLAQLNEPGVYEVGGLGACTLLSVPALKKGLNFLPIKNVSVWGEDRWFCIRAAALGIPLFVDTHFPAKHLYRESDLEEVSG